MSRPNANPESAVYRCPTEIWEQILITLVYSSRTHPVYNQHVMPLSRGGHARYSFHFSFDEVYQPHTTAWRDWCEDVRFKVEPTSIVTLNSLDWSYRLVCRAWSRFLLPFLLDTIRIHRNYTELDEVLAMLGTNGGSQLRGHYVRCLLVQIGYLQDWDIKEPDTAIATATMAKLFKRCPKLEELRYIDDVILPSPDLTMSVCSNLQRIALSWSTSIDAASFLDFCASLPSLYLLDLSRHNADTSRPGNTRNSFRWHLGTLTHLVLRLDSSWMRHITACALPRLQHLYALVSSLEEPQDGGEHAEHFFHLNGAKLRSIVFAHTTVPTRNDLELVVLELCPNVEEYTTCFPFIHSDTPFPVLAQLRSLGLSGFGLDEQAAQVLGLSDIGIAGLPEATLAFFSKLNRVNTPSLAVIKALDLESHKARDTAWTKTISAVTEICQARGIRFQDALERPVFLPSVHTANPVSFLASGFTSRPAPSRFPSHG
ncbi:hypothetical protein CALCODRAFT_287430 [Calocera cornea HHB12733]|uniref:F-box domain-containing protein n=1 Tax=Calocera cornea HHB12733 TaxID=1353952 RepID=A0A165FY08_9BASI|nr:hypothetical protein CALCODRAFT_287430 [Calocera cornea HHB12733]